MRALIYRLALFVDHTSVSPDPHSGIWFHFSPSSFLPPAFGVLPPHCLKKNGTSAATHSSRSAVTHCGSNGRHPGPLSPPAMTQWIPPELSTLQRLNGPISGSQLRNRTAAGTCFRCRIRYAVF